MVTLIGLVGLAVLLVVLLLLRSTLKSEKPAPQPPRGDARAEDTRATGLN
jgi:hypothetical protein